MPAELPKVRPDRALACEVKNAILDVSLNRQKCYIARLFRDYYGVKMCNQEVVIGIVVLKFSP